MLGAVPLIYAFVPTPGASRGRLALTARAPGARTPVGLRLATGAATFATSTAFPCFAGNARTATSNSASAPRNRFASASRNRFRMGGGV